ncbi:wax ester/triacylglycerol synthase family O-acyltransferase [Nocardia sp. bgisy134]|uniref:wax ester/triacylglycerol synthase family O-acyltransferase n=1 Tax=Nocardia sp. bgisy134 TaxID=3413789 RepID=UPI003D7548E9
MSHRIAAERKGNIVGRQKRSKHLRIDESFWVWLESPTTPMHVAALATFETDGEPAAEVVRRILADFRKRTDVDPRFRTVIRMRRFPRRARRALVDDIDLDFHLRHHTLSAAGGESELAQLVSQLRSSRFDTRRPMWQVHVIEGLSGNRFAVYLAAHHALINGVDAVRLLSRSLATDGGAPVATPVWTIGRPRPTDIEARRATKSRPNPARALFAAAKAVGTLFLAWRTNAPLTGPFTAPRSRLNVDIGPRRRVCTASIDLNRIKDLSKASGASPNDIVLAACSTALRRYLLDIGGLPDKPLIAGCPVSIAAPEGSNADSSIGIMFADLATDQPDPAARLTTISRSTTAAKNHQAALPHAAPLPYSILAMAPHTIRQLTPGAVERLAPAFNLIVSNVPGPSQPRYLAGARMAGLYPLSLLFKGEALNITAVSYAGRMHLGFTACPTALPEVQLLARYIDDAVDELEDRYATAIPDLPKPA